jgi:hypothetical protein
LKPGSYGKEKKESQKAKDDIHRFGTPEKFQ